MKLGKIEKINFVESSRLTSKKAGEKFLDLEKEFLTEDDIKEIANQIAERILNNPNTGDNTLTIIDALNPEAILKQLDSKDQSEVNISDLELPLARIQQAVMDRLASRLDPKTFNFVVKKLSANRKRVFELREQQIYKRGFFNAAGLEKEDLNTYYEENLQKLYDLPEKSPYIAYPLLATAVYGRETEEIQEKLEFVTLDDFINEKNPKITEALRMIIDFMRGHLFLVKNGLVLTDNSLGNIAVFDTTSSSHTGVKHIAKIFDLDGLLTLNQSMSKQDFIFAKQSNTPT